MKAYKSLFLLIFGLILMGCSSGPSDEDIKAAISAYYDGKPTTTTWVSEEEELRHPLMVWAFDCTNLLILQTEIIKRGQKQNDIFGEPYYPVMVHINGSCISEPDRKTITFDKTGEFNIQLDPYGEWVGFP